MQTEAEQPPGNPLALVVDDERPLAQLIARVLGRAQIDSLSAASADEGLELFLARPKEIDVVVLDMNMPGRSGADLYPELLAIEPELPVVLMSGTHLPEDLREQLLSNGGRFLQKPFVAGRLLSVVEEVLTDRAKHLRLTSEKRRTLRKGKEALSAARSRPGFAGGNH